MNIILRKCITEDLLELRELSIKTFYETYAHMNTDKDMEDYLENAFGVEKLCRELKDNNSEFYFLYHNEKLSGYIKLNEAPSQTDINDKTSLEIERIYVLSEFQGKGFGKYLIGNAIEMARGRDKQYIWLGVWEKNEKAILFYKKNGFYKIGTHSFFMGEDEQTDYLMRKNI